MENDRKLLSILDDTAQLSDSLMLAAERGDLAQVRSVVTRGVDINRCRGLKLFTPLHHAANRGHLHVAKVP